MNVYYRKATGEVVYQGATGLPKSSVQAFEEADWRHNLGPRGFSANDIETLWVDEDDPAVLDMLLYDVIEIDVAAEQPVVRSKGKRPPPASLPDIVQKHQAAPTRLTALRKKGAAAMTPAERNEALDLMLLERTPLHELMSGG